MSFTAALILAASASPQVAVAEATPARSGVAATATATVTILRPATVSFERVGQEAEQSDQEAMQRQVNRRGQRVLIEFS